MLSKLQAWGEENGASLALEKCKVLHICRKKNCIFPSLNFNAKKIESVKELKILGVIFDNNLKFKNHCIQIKKKLLERLNIIKYLISTGSCIHPNILINVISNALKN